MCWVKTQFRDGLRLYLKDHAYANAEWADLVGAFEKVSGQKLGPWADAYIKRRGMPQVDVEKFYCDHPDRVQSLVLKQHDVLDEGGVWPITTQVLLGYWNRPSVRVKVQLNSETTDIGKQVYGNTCPDFVFANDQDYAYGRFLLDARQSQGSDGEAGRHRRCV